MRAAAGGEEEAVRLGRRAGHRTGERSVAGSCGAPGEESAGFCGTTLELSNASLLRVPWEVLGQVTVP